MIREDAFQNPSAPHQHQQTGLRSIGHGLTGLRSARRRSRVGSSRRRGVILLLVVVVVAAFSVAAYSFSHMMLTELSIVKATGQSDKQRLLAESAIEQLIEADVTTLSALSLPIDQRTDRIGELSALSHVAIAQFTHPGDRQPTGHYAILRDIPRPGEPVQFGLANESAKLNLNSLTLKKYTRKQVVAKLMRYRELSEPTAEGIADLLGIVEPDQFGVKPQPSGQLPGRRLVSFDQLLSVPGITPELLYGEDRNGNGLLDPNEDDGAASLPPDNNDGRLNAGWIGEWTLTGAESLFQQNGSPKINLNQSDLVTLYDQLIEFATPEEAAFVVAWRLSAPMYTDSTSEDGDYITEAEILEERRRTVRDRLKAQLGNDVAESDAMQPRSSEEDDTIRAGIDLGVRTNHKFESLLELASCQLQIIVNEEDTVLVSPFANDAASLSRWLPRWQRRVTVADGGTGEGRIDIFQASQATLETVRGISPQLAQAIVAKRSQLRAFDNAKNTRPKTVGWLLESGLMTSAELRSVAGEITVGGCVFRGIVIGQLTSSRTLTAIYVELDGTGPKVRLRRFVDLPPLGNRYRLPIE